MYWRKYIDISPHFSKCLYKIVQQFRDYTQWEREYTFFAGVLLVR